VLQRAALELFDGALRSPHRTRRFGDAPSLSETQFDHPTLIVGKPMDKLVKHRAAFDIRIVRLDIPRRFSGLARELLPAIRQFVRGDAKEPRGERHAAPLVGVQLGERAMKHFGRDVFRLGPAGRAADHVGIEPVEVPIVEIEKPGRIGLRGLHQALLVELVSGGQGVCSREGNRGQRKKVTRGLRNVDGREEVYVVAVRLFATLVMVGFVAFQAGAARGQPEPVSPATKALGESWDRAYLEAVPSFTPEPNVFLVEVVKGLQPGSALDVGMGQGRNAVFLARQGWKVTGFDVSEVGVRQAKEQAAKSGVALTALVQSSDEFNWGTAQWDLIVLTYFPQLRRSMPKVIESLKPGGVVLVEAFHADAAVDRPPGPGRGVTFQANELPQLVAPLRVVRYEEPRARADWGIFETRLVRILARKP
jgi:predicted O-methyltransferase YrrM